jgi:ribosome-binding factor A
MDTRHQKLLRSLSEETSLFINRQSNKKSLITITRALLNEKEDRITFFVHIIPESYESTALLFLTRKTRECRDYLKKRVPLRRIPFISFVSDEGEKNRQRIDELLQKERDEKEKREKNV